MAVQQHKVLRIRVLQGGKLLEERVMGAGQAVTVGTSPRNVVALAQPGLPESFTVLEWQGDRCLLRFAAGMDGWVKGPGGGELSALAASGKARKDGNGWVLPVGEELHGEVAFGGVALAWRFVTAPQDLPQPVLPPKATANHFKSLDSLF